MMESFNIEHFKYCLIPVKFIKNNGLIQHGKKKLSLAII